ncbi:tripartite tricarboxylate transporter substrate binding protein [Pseudolabrys taiwanensis]|uniref:Tripartite tricarboxylate transporter substrate binding protein n=1 Tax=Pseudolabrys taiwanensis TaxID=331696 RepID=A0A345ZW08_9HYPH|nr:tripartite tricarboxylate transporter substrate binding protein [Pseudolabrys taiwanensis]AXK81105.1 tripartite tricarboxylate transporter substrate binding protein [Pseudolabrys taiwanensis]
MTVKMRLSAIAAAIGLTLFSTASFAQSFPTKPVRLILPYSPGGIVDYVGRTLAQHLGDALGQPVVAENRPGAGGIVGTDTVARSAPDGYTLLLMDPAIVINPTLQESVPYDLFKQLEAVSVVSSSPEVLVVSPQLGVKTFEEFVAYGKANPGKLNFASAGVGTTPHLGGEMFMQATGIVATHVPYKSIGSSYTDMMANKVQFAFSSIAGALPFTTDNRVIPLATTGDKRSEVYPDKPTVQEAGIKGFSVDLWLTVFAPAGVPAPVKAKLNEAIKTALAKPELKAAFAKVGVTPRGTSLEEGAAFVKADFEKWKKVIVDGKIKL